MTEKTSEKSNKDASAKVKKFLLVSKDEKISYEVSVDENDKEKGERNYSSKKGEKDSEKARNEAIKSNCKEALKSENLVILTGAGSSIDGGGKSVSGIWEEIFEEKNSQEGNDAKNQKKLKLHDVLQSISNDIEKIKEEDFCKNKNLEELLSRLEIEKIKEEDFCKNKNLEELLSRLEIERKARKNKGEDDEKISTQIKEINAQIKNLCSEKNSEPKTHKDFLTKILTARKKTSPRAKIFTLNYDTFFEDAASEIKAVVIDGFCFNEKRIFNSTDFDFDIVQRENSRIHKEENFYDKVFHLYKMHGSVTWKLEGKEIKKLDKTQIDEPLLIYPNASKFEESYQMPFYEMISRFQISLRATNTTLMIIGYSFGDAHVNRMIEEAVDSNLSLKVIVVDPNIEEVDEKKAKEASENLKNSLINYAKNSARITFFGATFKDFVEALPEISYENEREKTLKEAILEAFEPNNNQGEKNG